MLETERKIDIPEITTYEVVPSIWNSLSPRERDEGKEKIRVKCLKCGRTWKAEKPDEGMDKCPFCYNNLGNSPYYVSSGGNEKYKYFTAAYIDETKRTIDILLLTVDFDVHTYKIEKVPQKLICIDKKTLETQNYTYYEKGKVFFAEDKVADGGGIYRDEEIIGPIAEKAKVNEIIRETFTGSLDRLGNNIVIYLQAWLKNPAFAELSEKPALAKAFIKENEFTSFNYDGTTLAQILKIPEAALEAYDEYAFSRHPISAIQDICSKEDNASKEVYHWIMSVNDMETIKELIKYTGSLKKTYEFTHKMMELEKFGPSEVAETWRSYIRECQRINRDIKDENVLYPYSLAGAYQNAVRTYLYG